MYKYYITYFIYTYYIKNDIYILYKCVHAELAFSYTFSIFILGISRKRSENISWLVGPLSMIWRLDSEKSRL